MTLHDCVEEAARILAAAGFAAGDARRDAAVLARFILGWSMTDWAARLRDPAPAFLREQLNALATRRSSGEPVAYITGTREFYGRPFLVTPAVLIPRPETEGLIDEAITVLRTRRTGTRPIVVDIGTGSGCIAVTLALECPGARIVATDISQPALELAAMNAAALGATVEFEHVGGSEFIAPSVPAADLIVSNPPYVSERDRPSLPIDVREFEPHTALFAAGEGLEVIRRLIRVADGVLAPGGALVMEIGAGQAAAVSALVACSSLELAGIRPDLQGIPRIVVARKSPG